MVPAIAVVIAAGIVVVLMLSMYTQEKISISKDDELNLALYCGSGIAKSTEYIKEYVIPTPCAQPIGIVVDGDGYVWFAESSVRKIARFDPKIETFEEFSLPDGAVSRDFATSGMWSMILDENQDIWFTDVGGNSIWKFYRTSKIFERYKIPTQGSFPLGLAVDKDGKIWFTEAFGKKFGYVDPKQRILYELSPPIQPDIMGGLTIDRHNNVWFNILQASGGYVIMYEQATGYYKKYPMPIGVTSPIGISIDNEGNAWVSDHGTSIFFKLDTRNNMTKTYVTSMPLPRTSIGTGGQPTTLPYWNMIDKDGRIWINEHQGSMIAVLDPSNGSLIEYFVPSQNPWYGSCEGQENCGIANPLQFAMAPDGRIWFTEWSESKIGVLNPDIQIPFSLDLDKNIVEVERGRAVKIGMEIVSDSIDVSDAVLSLSGTFTPSGQLWRMNTLLDAMPNSDVRKVVLTLNPSQYLVAGTYNIMVSANYGDVVYSKALEVVVKEPSPIIRSFVRGQTFAGFVTGDGWVELDKDRYEVGTYATISGGFLSHYDPVEPVYVRVYAPDDSEYSSHKVAIEPSGRFRVQFLLDDIRLFGTYKVIASYAEDNVILYFNVENPADKPEAFQFSFNRISYNPSFYCAKYSLAGYVESEEQLNAIESSGRIRMRAGTIEKTGAEDDGMAIRIPIAPIDIDSGLRIAVVHSEINVYKDGKILWNNRIHSHCGNTDVIIKSRNIAVGDSIRVEAPFSMEIGVTQHFLQNVYESTYTLPTFNEKGKYTVDAQLVWIDFLPIQKPPPVTLSFSVE